MYNSLDSTSLDTDGVLTALLNLYSTIITDRNLKFNILSKTDIAQQVLSAICRSVTENNLLRFTDNECFSVFLPTDEISTESPESVRFISDKELRENYAANELIRMSNIVRKRRPVSSSSSSDDDFEEKPQFRGATKRIKGAAFQFHSDIDELPKFVEPCESDRLRSKARLRNIQDLANCPTSTSSSNCKKSVSSPSKVSEADGVSFDENRASVVDGGSVDEDKASVADGASVDSKIADGANGDDKDKKSTGASSSNKTDITSVDRVQPVAEGPKMSVSHSEKSLKSAQTGGTQAYKHQMSCRNPHCWKGKTGRKLHYHCLICKTHLSKEFRRVAAHMLKCPLSNNVFLNPDSDKKIGCGSVDKDIANCVAGGASVDEEKASVVDGASVDEETVSVVDCASVDEEKVSVVDCASVDEEKVSVVDCASVDEEKVSVVDCASVDEEKVSVVDGASVDNKISHGGTANPVDGGLVNTSTATHCSLDDLVACWDNGPNCKIVASRPKMKHFHCKICEASHTSLKRMTEHVLKCKQKQCLTTHSVRKKNKDSGSDKKSLLQAELICPNSGIYLVRRGTQGPAAPVHVRVNKNGWECTVQSCKDLRNFHGGSLNPAFLCDHALACVNRNLTTQGDLLNDSANFDSFGEDDKLAILAFCKDAKDFGALVIKQFLPEMADNSKTSRYLYYSVFAGTGVIKYYSRLRRVLVTYDRSLQTHKCDCSVRSCIHKKIAVLVSQINPITKEDRPEDMIDKDELHRAKLNMEYVLERKKIPFDVSDFMDEVSVTEFVPSETHCYKCEDVELVILSSHNHGNIFSIEKKITGVKVVTKHCPSCKIEYRYSEYKDGYFNYNNNSFFTISMMEQGLTAWIKNTPISSFLEIMKVRTKLEYNVHLILNAVKAYMALKDLGLTSNLSCNRCGDYPVHLSYDVIRSLCFDLDPSSIGDHQYDSFDGVYNDCCQHDLARGYLDSKSCHFNRNMKELSVKLSQHLPPLICPKNFGGLSPYTRQLLETDKAEEVRLPLERIEQLLKSKQAYKELKRLCDSLHIETRGGKSQMMTRLIANEGNAEVYSVIRKKFTKITGKSGGILRAFCIHGICYALKFLTLPESVADYTNVITGFQVLPNFNFMDVAGHVPVHTNKHFPGTFRPFLGRVDNPEDPLSDLYKDQQKVAVYDYDTYTTAEVDRDNYNHKTAHPVSGLIEVLALYDEMHESNHHEYDRHLRSLKSTNLQAWSNTSVSEQQNHKISLVKSFSNEMDANQHIKFVTYLTCAHNKRNNDQWKKKVQTSAKLQTRIDHLGFLVLNNVDKSTMNTQNFDTMSTNNLKSPHPTAVLQDPSDDASALNSVVYALCQSHMSDPILESAGCVGHQLVRFGSGKTAYNQEVHFKSKKLIEKHMSSIGLGSIMNPVNILKAVFVEDLVRLGVILAVESASSLNIGIALAQCLIKKKSGIDYVVLHKNDRDMKQFFNGLRPNFNIYLPHFDREVRYSLSAFVSDTGSGRYSCFSRYGDNVYEMQNTKTTLITETAYLEFARSAQFVIFKLSTPVKNQSNNCSKERPKRPANFIDTGTTSDVFEFEPPPKKVKLGKRKITVAQQINEVPRLWLGQSDTGRLDLYSEQFKICQSTSKWYDDIIINSYALMCSQYRRSSFSYQDTCLTNVYSPGKLSSVDQKFIQILNPYNSHWFCASNALTFVNEPHVVELFDSMKSADTLVSVRVLDFQLTQLILQLKPQTTVIRYIDCQKQLNSYDCGPYALGFLWALSLGHHPLQYDHLRGPMIRNKVRQSFIENRFIPPCNTSPKMYKRRVLKSFDLDSTNKRFVARI